MAMQKNRNLFHLSLIWMCIFVCLQCLVVKSLPTGNSTTVTVKSTINHTVHSQTEKDSGTLVVTTAQNVTPNSTNNVSSHILNPHNKTTVHTSLDNKMSNGQANTQIPTIKTTDVNKTTASPKNVIGGSATSKKPMGSGGQIETPSTKKPDETESQSGLNKSTTTKNPDETQDQSGQDKSPTTQKPVETQDQSGRNKSLTTKKPDETQDQNGLNKSLTTQKPVETQDQNGLNKSLTTQKPDETKDQSGVNKSTTQKPVETQDQIGLNKSPTTQKPVETQDQIGLNKSPTTKKPTESADENVQNNMSGSKISLDTGETNDGKNDKNKKPMNSGTLYGDDEDSGGHFMAYFITFVVICIAGYIIYHNKQKILAFILEGKKDGSRRRPNSKEYKRLKTDEVMPSLEKNTSDNKYIY